MSMDFDLVDFYTAKKYIEGAGITDLEIGQEAARLCGLVLDSEDITAAATLCLNSICRELLNIEQRQRAGYKSTHQQIMLGRWANLLNHLVDRLQGVFSIDIFEPGDAALKYFEYHSTLSAAALKLPKEFEQARQYFTRAIEAGYMKTTAKGAEWLQKPARLGYFCLKAFTSPRPVAMLEKYFNCGRLSGAITQAGYDASRADVIKWRGEMDSKIFNIAPPTSPE